MFVAHSAEPALLTLGQWAWESGNLTAARGYWSQLLPLPDAALAEPADTVLRYPDPQTDPAEIAARLVMASIVAGDWHLAGFQLAGFRHRFGQARGRLGDREGILADLLAQSAGRARDWSFPPRDTSVATFGMNAARNGVLPREIEVGAAALVDRAAAGLLCAGAPAGQRSRTAPHVPGRLQPFLDREHRRADPGLGRAHGQAGLGRRSRREPGHLFGHARCLGPVSSSISCRHAPLHDDDRRRPPVCAHGRSHDRPPAEHAARVR